VLFGAVEDQTLGKLGPRALRALTTRLAPAVLRSCKLMYVLIAEERSILPEHINMTHAALQTLVVAGVWQAARWDAGWGAGWGRPAPRRWCGGWGWGAQLPGAVVGQCV
jgi:hypothetical protein